MDDTVARYDPMEAVEEIAATTGLDVRTVASVLEGEIDYLSCLGLLNESGLDEAARNEIEALRAENADLFELSSGEYDMDVAVSFIQRNRGIEREIIARVLEANLEFMDRRGLLDEEWEEDWARPDTTPRS